MIRIIPSLLLSKKKLVKGTRFSDFKNAGSPVTTISALENQKADEIFLIDLDSYKFREKIDTEILKKVAEVSSTPISFGGGIDNEFKARKALTLGADKIFLNTILFKDKKIIKKIAYSFGSQAIVGGLNILEKSGQYTLLEDLTGKINPLEYAKKLEQSGVGELKVTFVNREGTKEGLDIEYSKKLLKEVKIPIIFEGGIGNLNDIVMCLKNGIKSIALSTIITFNDNNIIKIKQHIRNAGFNVRI